MPSKEKIDPLAPSVGLLVKIGSIAVHADEFTSSDGHEFDLTALKTLFGDPEVSEWIKAMTAKGFLPVKREP